MPTVDDYARFFSGQISRQQIDALRERDGVAAPQRRREPAPRRTVATRGGAPRAVSPRVTGSDVDAFQRDLPTRDRLQRDLLERDTVQQRQIARQIADQHAAAQRADDLRLADDLQRQELDRLAAQPLPDAVDSTYDTLSVRSFGDF